APGLMVGDFIYELDNLVVVEIFRSFWTAVAFNIRATSVDAPRLVRNSPTNESIVFRLTAPNCDIRLTFGEVKKSIGHQKFDLKFRVARMEIIEHVRFH